MTEGVTNRKKKGRSGDPDRVEDSATEEDAMDAPDPDAADAAEGADTVEPEPEDGKASDGRSVSFDEAVANARRRAVEEPDNVEARIELARLYRDRGDAGLALEQLEAARSEASEDVDLLTELGITLAAMSRLTDAERDLRRAQKLDPGRADIHAHLGLVLFKRGLYRQAEVALKRATELDDRDGEAYFYRGEALNQLGRVDDALAMLERSVQYDPTNAKAYYTMGILYDRKHMREEATTMYRKARELGGA